MAKTQKREIRNVEVVSNQPFIVLMGDKGFKVMPNAGYYDANKHQLIGFADTQEDGGQVINRYCQAAVS